MRIVSLHPAATEMVAALGLLECLVGRSHECDHPAPVSDIPSLTSTSLADTGSSRAIDAAVRTSSASDPMYQLDAALLRALRPDFILAQSECARCAVDPSMVETALREWPGTRPEILVTGSPASAAAMGAELLDLARGLGVEEVGYSVLEPLIARLGAVWELAQMRCPRRPRTLLLEWFEPPYPCGSWLPLLIEEAGGEAVLSRAGLPARAHAWDAIVQADPDVVVVAACGFPVQRTLDEWGGLERNPHFASLRARRDGRVFVADGNAYFNRPGPRLVDSVEILARALHPPLADSLPRLASGSLWNAERNAWVL